MNTIETHAPNTDTTPVVDSASEITVVRTTQLRHLQPGDILSDGRIVSGVQTGDGGSMVFFEPFLAITESGVSIGDRDYNELEVGDWMVLENEQRIRQIAEIVLHPRVGDTAAHAAVRFEEMDEDTMPRFFPEGELYPVVIVWR